MFHLHYGDKAYLSIKFKPKVQIIFCESFTVFTWWRGPNCGLEVIWALAKAPPRLEDPGLNKGYIPLKVQKQRHVIILYELAFTLLIAVYLHWYLKVLSFLLTEYKYIIYYSNKETVKIIMFGPSIHIYIGIYFFHFLIQNFQFLFKELETMTYIQYNIQNLFYKFWFKQILYFQLNLNMSPALIVCTWLYVVFSFHH